MNKIQILLFGLLIISCNTSPDYILSEENPPITQERKANILSAFFGLDNSLPLTSASLWKDAPGQDGMPVVFSHEIDPTTLDTSDFIITTMKGEQKSVDFVTLKPASEAFELRTVLLIGEYGNNPDNEPILVEIIGDLKTRDGQQLYGKKIEVTPLDRGPFISYAEYFTMDADYPYNSKKKGCDCPKQETALVVRTVWAGGVVATDGKELGKEQLKKFTVILKGGEQTVQVHPFQFGDLQDNDNNVDLCFKENGIPIHVAVDANIVIDPNGDKNPKTSSIIISRW